MNYAVQGELQDLAVLIHAVGDEVYRQAIGMCVYVAVVRRSSEAGLPMGSRDSAVAFPRFA
jgi:hypothetical protein